MEEEAQNSTWSDLKKTIIGTIGTLVAAGGAWLGSQLFGGADEPAQPQQQSAQPAININLQNNNTNQQSASSGGSKTVIIKEKEVPAKESKPVTTKKKEGDEFKEQAPQW
jgi:hypothetical protein